MRPLHPRPFAITRHEPRGLLRWGVRLPIWLYRLRLGWLLGERFLLLTHRGRRSGLPRLAVLEVIRHDRAADTFFVAAAWGRKAAWFRNILHNPNVMITAGRRHLPARAERLAAASGAAELHRYAMSHPLAFQAITRVVVGRPLKGSLENCQRLAEAAPIVAFRVKRPNRPGGRLPLDERDVSRDSTT